LANIDYGWDRHVYDIPPDKIVPTLKIAMAAKIMFTSAATFTRHSTLCFYYRLIHESGKRLFLWIIHANVALSVAIFITFVFLTIFQCHPIRYYWTFGSPAGSCMDEGKVTLAAGIINLVADLFCTVLPIPMVTKVSDDPFRLETEEQVLMETLASDAEEATHCCRPPVERGLYRCHCRHRADVVHLPKSRRRVRFDVVFFFSVDCCCS
jgi:hypothetical protein